MRFFFIDTENVQQYSFIEEMKVDENDTVLMFISERSKKIRTEDLRRFTECKAKIIYEDVYTGEKNALDFQLITNMTLTIANNQEINVEYIIVSNDNDFELPLRYLRDKTEANIQILKTDTNQLAITSDINMDIYNKFNLNKEVREVIMDSETLSQLHNNLKNLLGNEKGRHLYNEIKMIFKNSIKE